MANNDTAALVVALSAQLSKFEKDMQDAGEIADRQVTSIEQRFAASTPSFNFAAGLISAATVAGAVSSIKSVIDTLAELGDKASDLHLPVEELQALGTGAQQARVSGEELNSGLKKFSDVSKKTREDAEEFYKSLSNIGSAFADAFKNAPTQSERLRILGQAMGSTDDAVKRAQLGLQAFGSDSERVTGFIASLSTGLDTLVARARDLGIQIDGAMVKQAQTAQTELKTLATIIGAELTISIASLIPTIVSLLPKLQQLGALARDALASFAPADKRPTETLKNELNDSVATIARYQSEMENLRGKADSASDRKGYFGLGSSEKDAVDEEIATLQKKVDAERKFLEQREQILARRKTQEEADKKLDGGRKDSFAGRGSLKTPKDEPDDAFDRTAEQITRHTASLTADTIAVGQNSAVQAQLRAEFQLLNAIRKDEGEVTQAQLEQYQKLRETMSAYQALQQAGISLSPEHKKTFFDATDGARSAAASYDAAREAVNRLNAASSQVGSALSSAFADAVVEGKSLNDVMGSLIKTLEKAAINGVFNSFFNPSSPGGISSFGNPFTRNAT